MQTMREICDCLANGIKYRQSAEARCVIKEGGSSHGVRRRTILKGAAVSAAAAGLPVVGRAQADPIKVGILALTGAGGNDGPRMLKAMQLVFEEVNKAGGVMGHHITTVIGVAQMILLFLFFFFGGGGRLRVNKIFQQFHAQTAWEFSQFAYLSYCPNCTCEILLNRRGR